MRTQHKEASDQEVKWLEANRAERNNDNTRGQTMKNHSAESTEIELADTTAAAFSPARGD
jgi:hypothetical protein